MDLNSYDCIVANGKEVDRVVFNGADVWQKEDNTLLYSVGLLSDVHIQTSATEASRSQADFANALQFFRDAGCTFTCISGDLTDGGTDAEFAKFVEVRDANRGQMPVFAVTGNHEASSARTYTRLIAESTCIAHNINRLIGNHFCYYVKNGRITYWDISTENYTVYTASNVTIEDASITIPESDVYIFVGILGDANNALFWDGLFQWLYNVLEEHKSKRCFLFEHCRAEKLVWSSTDKAYVDDTYKDYVSGNTGGFYLKSLWGSGNYAKEFETLLSHYTNCIWFHGHTHLVAETNELSDIANVDKHFGNKFVFGTPSASADNTTWSWSVHLPSVAEPRTVGDTALNVVSGRSQGALMEVYRRHVVIRYVNFATVTGNEITYANEFIDTAVYNLDTRRDSIGIYTPATNLVTVI